MKKPPSLRPGQTAEVSGIYGMVGKRGGATGHERTIVKDETAPPTLKPGQSFILIRKTKT